MFRYKSDDEFEETSPKTRIDLDMNLIPTQSEQQIETPVLGEQRTKMEMPPSANPTRKLEELSKRVIQNARHNFRVGEGRSARKQTTSQKSEERIFHESPVRRIEEVSYRSRKQESENLHPQSYRYIDEHH